MDALQEQPLHHPAGTVTTFRIYSHFCMTNARAHALAIHPAISSVCDDDVEITPSGFKLKMQAELGQSPLKRLGLLSQLEDSREGGKFVFFKDRTFVLIPHGVTHSDLLVYFKKIDRVAVYSAGFARIAPDGIVLHGRSISLDREADTFGMCDSAAIVAHLKVQTEIESVDL